MLTSKALPARIIIYCFVLSMILLQTGCLVIGTAGTIATTTVKSTVSIAGHTAKTALDVAIPDGEDKK